MKQPAHQRASLYILWTVNGLIFLGGIIDTLVGARDLITKTITYWGTFLIILIALVIHLFMKFRGLRWVSMSGEDVILRGLNFGILLPIFGMLVLLWIPRTGLLPDPQSEPREVVVVAQTIVPTPTMPTAQKIYYVILIDASARMAIEGGSNTTKWSVIQESVNIHLLDGIVERSNYALITIGGPSATNTTSCQDNWKTLVPMAFDNREEIIDKVNSIEIGGDAPLTQALKEARNILFELPDDLQKNLFIFIGGGDNCFEDEWSRPLTVLEDSFNSFNVRTELVLLNTETMDASVLEELDVRIKNLDGFVQLHMPSPEDLPRVIARIAQESLSNASEFEPTAVAAQQTAIRVSTVQSEISTTSSPSATTPAPMTVTPMPSPTVHVPPTLTQTSPLPTPVPPSATSVPPSATQQPNTATPLPPTATSAPSTATPIPPTNTPVQLSVNINKPKDGSMVTSPTDMAWVITGELTSGMKPVVIVKDPLGGLWAYTHGTNNGGGNWSLEQVILGNENDCGKNFTLYVVLTVENVSAGSVPSLPGGPRDSVTVGKTCN